MRHPGPWKMIVDEDDGRAVTIEDANGRCLICPSVSAESPTIATLEAERLILAAPELLSALKETVSELDLCTWADMDGETERLRAVVARSEALIERIERIEKGST